jgi:bZIP transcription factor
MSSSRSEKWLNGLPHQSHRVWVNIVKVAGYADGTDIQLMNSAWRPIIWMNRMQDAGSLEQGNVESSKGPTEMDRERLALRKEAMTRRRSEDTGDDSDDGDESASPPNEGGSLSGNNDTVGGDSGGDMDKLALSRRAKRLAMNRESARNRRKRKKVLIQTLEVQVAEVSKSNQNYQLANETLSARVRTLENELMMARNTINQLSSAAGLGNPQGLTSGGIPTQLQQRFGHSQGSAHLSGGNASSLGPSLSANEGFEHQFRGLPASAHAQDVARGSSGGGGGESLGRLMQAQFEQYALQGGSSGMPFGVITAATASGVGPQFSDDSLLRRRAMDLQALSQASRESALGSMVSASRFGLPNSMDDRNSFGLRGQDNSLGISQDAFQNMVRCLMHVPSNHTLV